MDRAYYEARLTYDLSRDFKLRDNQDINILNERNIEITDKELGEAVSALISQLFIDLSDLFSDEDSHDDIKDNNNSELDILSYTEGVLKETRNEVNGCLSDMIIISEILKNLTNELSKLKIAFEMFMKQNGTMLNSLDSQNRASHLWLLGAEEKLKLCTLQLIRNTYIDNENTIIPALKIIKDKLEEKRSLQLLEREKVSNRVNDMHLSFIRLRSIHLYGYMYTCILLFIDIFVNLPFYYVCNFS